MREPNILWICSDQQRWDTLGCYGNQYVRTPNIDSLADGGVLFENCYVQNPVCSPSRASFLTGRYPSRTGCRQNGQAISEDETVITKILHDAGYTCGLSGKYHLMPASPQVNPQCEPRINDGYDVFEWSHGHSPKHPGNRYHQWLSDQGVKYKTETSDTCGHIETGMPEEHHQTTWCVERAISYIEQCRQHDMPWLYSINTFDPHPPFDPPAEYLKRYVQKIGIEHIPLPNYVKGELDGKPAFQKKFNAASPGGITNIKGFRPAQMSGRDHRHVRAAYWAMVDLIDHQVGRLVDYLRQVGEYENTIIIFMSDHGEMLGDHGMYYKGLSLYEAALHVPLIIHYPKQLKVRRIGANVEMLHLAPTLLEAVGLSAASGMQSTSLWSALVDNEPIQTEDVFAEYYNSMVNEIGPAAENYSSMVRSGDWKIVLYHGTSEGELYDVSNDPNETHNLFLDRRYVDRKAEMLVRLSNKMAWTTDPLPERLGTF